MPIARVREYVQQYEPAIEPLVFEEELHTSQAAADALGVEVGQIAKSILFASQGEYALFVASGDVRINSKKMKELLGNKAKMATPEEVVEVTGFIVGAVCPFALRQEIPIYIDETLVRFDRIYTAAGIPESVLPLTFEQLVRISGGSVTAV
ncbi:YbaK/EbsC family protein [Brevibacillus ginsengisoli]|uniref:YbaK/EbsC family protein n=1 Tax=Brevibacillus ginsengisoli TaxID=363854 RepID=UPI003CF65DAD